ncbi:SGNH/GDSL hydrolase family protein [Rheinheimera sp. MMS21-TC3]|uniref:SGNH/GDSL hydrolase family protein n=1 Tax=Rheinheimera sp. MMS21-TC3 TaxID=3072790 RepID=UPI0028C44CD0|nr:GDSL-type esterase/lipase family protein [Rheinheimera sp. MMS21-TC3]WNO60674.1 GDSL-type esterase/lipase family protein [Rheinheimera sp. MMS21-TC3]
MQRSIIKVFIFAFIIFISLELLLQIRAELKFGNSIFSSLLKPAQAETQLFTQRKGYKLLVPNISVEGSSISIKSNNLGLRSEPIKAKNNGSIRVIVLGASSAYGAYAANNSVTFPALLQQEAVQLPLEVINAGIPGNDLNGQYLLYSEHLAGLSEDVLMLYSGLSNDVSQLCRKSAAGKSYALPQIKAPKWLLSVDLLLKNTINLRYVPYKVSALPDLTPSLENYADGLRKLIKQAKLRQVKQIYFLENLSSFRPEQPVQLQRQLAETALYYTPCLSVQQFSYVFEQYNQTLQQVADEFNHVQYVSLSDKVAGGRDNFTDSVHFSAKGEQVMAQALIATLNGTLQVQP